MLMAATGRDVGLALCKTFNLDPNKVRNLELRCPCDGVATLSVDMYVDDYATLEHQKFRIVPLDEETC